MDLVIVLQPFFEFLGRFFGTSMVLGGYTFSIGSFFIWCVLLIVVIAFLKGLAG